MKNKNLKSLISSQKISQTDIEIITVDKYSDIVGGRDSSISIDNTDCPKLRSCTGFDNCGVNNL